MKPITIVDVAELPVDTKFVDLPSIDGVPVVWRRRSGLPLTALEQRITRPRLSRYRAAWQSAGDSVAATAIISHLPRMTAAVSDFAWLRGSRAPHLAFSFNFTDLPSRAERTRLRTSFARITQFAVYTQFEAELYADVFKIPLGHFRRIDWTQDPPTVGRVDAALIPKSPFVVAVGGEGRDFTTLMAAARDLPEVQFVVVARPSAALTNPPPNVTVYCNIPADLCWGIAARSAVLLVPLLTSDTCCGHITLVSGRQLGLPIITSRSRGTREYSEGFAATTLVEVGDSTQWVKAIQDLLAHPETIRAAAELEAASAIERHNRARWSEYVTNFIRRVR